VIAISKARWHDRGRQCCDTLAGIRSRKHLECDKTAPDKNLERQETVSGRNIRRSARPKKKPGVAGLP
jgi:hypothetical protein